MNQAVTFKRRSRASRLHELLAQLDADESGLVTQLEQAKTGGRTSRSTQAIEARYAPDRSQPELAGIAASAVETDAVVEPKVAPVVVVERGQVVKDGWHWPRSALSPEVIDIEETNEKIRFLAETRHALARVQRDGASLQAAVALMERAVAEPAIAERLDRDVEQSEVDAAVGDLLLFRGAASELPPSEDAARARFYLDLLRQEEMADESKPINRTIKWYRSLFEQFSIKSRPKQRHRFLTQAESERIFGNDLECVHVPVDPALEDAILLLEDLICERQDSDEQARRACSSLSPLASCSEALTSILHLHGWTRSTGFSNGLRMEQLLGDLLRARGVKWGDSPCGRVHFRPASRIQHADGSRIGIDAHGLDVTELLRAAGDTDRVNHFLQRQPEVRSSAAFPSFHNHLIAIRMQVVPDAGGDDGESEFSGVRHDVLPSPAAQTALSQRGEDPLELRKGDASIAANDIAVTFGPLCTVEADGRGECFRQQLILAHDDCGISSSTERCGKLDSTNVGIGRSARAHRRHSLLYHHAGEAPEEAPVLYASSSSEDDEAKHLVAEAAQNAARLARLRAKMNLGPRAYRENDAPSSLS